MASSSQALSRPRSSEDYVRSLSEIRSAAERASAGVNELLDLVRFDSGQAIPRLAPLRLDLLAEEVAASVRPDDAEVLANPTESVVVEADMALLRQAIDNLTRNAVRRASQVEIKVHTEGREALVDVLDNGPGFDPKILARVFDRYQRGDRRGDVGMGLAIVKAIVTAHGGTAEAANRPEGGAMVRLRLPMSSLSGR
jgi:two-component system, OmpR family, sensor kinase